GALSPRSWRRDPRGTAELARAARGSRARPWPGGRPRDRGDSDRRGYARDSRAWSWAGADRGGCSLGSRAAGAGRRALRRRAGGPGTPAPRGPGPEHGDPRRGYGPAAEPTSGVKPLSLFAYVNVGRNDELKSDMPPCGLSTRRGSGDATEGGREQLGGREEVARHAEDGVGEA